MRSSKALAVMLKPPAPGMVKTRLVPPLTHAEAAGFYECFIRDIFENIAVLKGIDLFAASFGDISRDKFKGIIPEAVEIFSQTGDGLGDKIFNVFKVLFENGYKEVAVIGSDSPDLPAEYIEEAFLMLGGEAELVLGPAIDGGYYLVAMSVLNSSVFDGINWSTPSVLEETLKKAKANSISFRLLRPWHDIDTPDDLRLLASSGAPLSSRFIKSLSAFKNLI